MRRESGPTQADVTLAEVASVIARAADLATGQPLDHVVRSCAIASLFAERLGLAPDVRDATYWVSLLMVSGCSAVSFELSRLFGDDIAVRGGGYDLGPSAIAQVRYVFGRVGGDAPLLTKTRVRVQLLGSKLRPFVNARDPRHCSINARLADRLGLGPEVGEALKVSFAQWNGGIPEGLGGNLNPPAGGAVETRVATPFCRAVDRATVTSRLAPTPEAALTPAGAAIITPAATQRTRKRFTICCSPSPRDGKALLIPHDDVAAQVTTRPTAICTRRAGLARLQVGRVLVILGVMAMAPNEALDQVAAELRLVCRRGLTAWNLADPGFPRLEAIFGGAAAARQGMAASLEAAAVSAAELLGGERATAARRLFGVDPGTRGLTLTVRRERAASAIHVSPEHFRKRIEPLLLREMAKESIGLTTRLPAKNLEPAEGPILIRTARGVPLIRPLWVGRTQPFILDPTPDARVVDSTHRFDLIEDSLRIDGFDGHFSFRYRGKNASQRTSRASRCLRLNPPTRNLGRLGMSAGSRSCLDT